MASALNVLHCRQKLDTQAVYLLDPAADAAPICVLRGDFDLAWDEMDCVYAVFRRVGDNQDKQRV